MKDPILKALIKYNRSFERLSDGTLIVSPMKQELCQGTLFGEKGSEWNPTPKQTEAASWFGMRPTTKWDAKWQKKWKEIVADFDFSSEDYDALKWYYTESGCKFLRKDLGTLLNNWQGEITRAKNYEPEKR